MTATDPLSGIRTRNTQTPQSERAPGDVGSRQKQNAAGGYAFQLGDDARLHRFLTLGTTGGTYYTSEQDLTKDNAEVILRMARENGVEVVRKVVEISEAGRAPKQNPGLFALAAVAGLGDDEARAAALSALPRVARIGTTLFQFISYAEQFRGWGRAMMKAVSAWYVGRTPENLAYQVVKYRQRHGWTHRDVLRQAHPGRWSELSDEQRALFDWITHFHNEVGGPTDKHPKAQYSDASTEKLPDIIAGYLTAQMLGGGSHQETLGDDYARLVMKHGLPWEALPDAAVTKPEVWKALIEKGMPQTALIRQLPRLTRLGVLEDKATRDRVVSQLKDPEQLRRGRVHPVSVLIAMKTYTQGRSERGSSTWTPNRKIVDALDAAYYAAYDTVEPANKRTLIALDVSGSMGSPAGGIPSLSCREASLAIALVIMATEPESELIGFTGGSLEPRGSYGFGGHYGMRYRGGRPSEMRDYYLNSVNELPISPRQRLDDAVRAVDGLPFGGTDCALPMMWAKEQSKSFDTFIVITDSETWAGNIHPHEALEQYRRSSGVSDARQIVVGMTANDVSIADPNDPLTLDVAGFDSAVPNMIADFSRGDI